MDDLENLLNRLRQDYLKARELMDVISKQDEVSNPYKSLYEARDILKSVLIQVQNLQDYFDQDSVSIISILINLDLGTIDLKTEELSSGEQRLEEAFTLLSSLKSSKTNLHLIEINILNQLILLWTIRVDYSKAMKYFELAQSIYQNWSKLPEKDKCLFDFVDCFNLNQSHSTLYQESVQKMETSYTQSLYFAAQISQKMGEKKVSASYCIQTLKRQYLNGDCNQLDWSINAATLSQYFSHCGQFRIAQHLLASALYILDEYANKYGNEEESVQKCVADLNLILFKYYFMLLNNDQAELSLDSLQLDELRIIPSSLIKEKENQIFATPVKTFEQARNVFLKAKSCLELALKYYTLDEHASDHIKCIQDLSKLYHALIKYESQPDRKCKMHKRRIDALVKVLGSINQKYFLGSCRQLLFELGEIYTAMVDIKLKSYQDKPCNDQKINHLISKAIEYYEQFEKTFKHNAAGDIERLDKEMVRPVMLAYFSIGRYFTKKICFDPRDQAQNWQLCESYYRKVKYYIEKNLDQKELVSEELDLIDELLTLIPLKMENILY